MEIVDYGPLWERPQGRCGQQAQEVITIAPGPMTGHKIVNRHSGIIRCACFLSFDLPGTPCLSRWERWLSEAKTERVNRDCQSPLSHLR